MPTTFVIDRANCAFCGNWTALSLHAPSGTRSICAECVGLCRQVLADEEYRPHRDAAVEHSCTFCDEREVHVGTLIYGPRVPICNGCVSEATRTLAENAR